MMIMNRQELLIPINETSPSGEMIRYDAIYREIQALRSGATDIQTDYKKLESTCVNTLKNSSKDLHVVAILTEAWANLYGLPGLTEGLNLIGDVCEAFWDTLHPNNLEDQEGRLSSFIWMDDKLSDVVLKIPMTAPKLPGMPIYTLANLIDARQLELVMQKSGLRRTDILDQAVKENRPTLELISKSMLITPADFYEKRVTEIKAATAAIHRLEAFLDDTFKDEAISLKSFDMYLMQIETYAKEAIEAKRIAPQVQVESEAETEAQEEQPNALNDAIQLPADQLYELLAKIAQRLEEIEPKSPAPKLVRKAIEWGSMSTAELFSDLARHDISITEINKLLG
jgi:type VI secretion system protein ImpA